MMFALWMPMSCYFYPRPPRGGRRYQLFHSFAFDGFLSTPSARRATAAICCWGFFFFRFLSTPSARRATVRSFDMCQQARISIHALREEGD